VQFLNALSPIDKTLTGIEIATKPEQPWNARAPIETTVFGMEIAVNAEHP
jgi:hypothetical protein